MRSRVSSSVPSIRFPERAVVSDGLAHLGEVPWKDILVPLIAAFLGAR